jgi:hypothetical protein
MQSPSDPREVEDDRGREPRLTPGKLLCNPAMARRNVSVIFVEDGLYSEYSAIPRKRSRSDSSQRFVFRLPERWL